MQSLVVKLLITWSDLFRFLCSLLVKFLVLVFSQSYVNILISLCPHTGFIFLPISHRIIKVLFPMYNIQTKKKGQKKKKQKNKT